MSWNHFKEHSLAVRELNFFIDYSKVHLPKDFFTSMSAKVQKAVSDMQALEAGGIANPDEKRMVGHYWLRNPERAPSAEIKKEIVDTLRKVEAFAAAVHTGKK